MASDESQQETALPEESHRSIRGPEPRTAVPSPEGQGEATVSLPLWSVSRETMEGPAERGTVAGGAAPPTGAAGYRLLDVIGRGGMGEVYAAVQESLGRVVAVKRLRGGEGSGPREADQRRLLFRKEAMIAALLEHPNIVPVHDLGADPEGRPLLAMKLIQGRPWDRALREDFGAMPSNEYLARHLPILVQVGQAVAFAHSRGIIHRDLKPAQVMLGEYGEVLLSDWGLAVFVGEKPVEMEQVKDRRHRAPSLAELPVPETASSPSGTPAFMAPEQTRASAREIGTWTDVWLLGATLYQVLTGRSPYESTSAAGAIAQAERGIVLPPRERAPERDIPQELADAAMACLRPEPTERLAGAGDLVARVQDYLSGATRRRQAAAIMAEVEARRARGGLSYGDFNDLQARLGEARSLWPEQPGCLALAEEVREQYARHALENGDRLLARVQADAMAEGEVREALLKAVDRADAAARRRELQRRAALAAVLVLMACAATLGLWANEERQRAERSLALAQEARGRAEDLMSFMLTDLRDSLRPLGRMKLLESVAAKAQDYFRDLPAELRTPQSAGQQALALVNIGDVQAQLGRKREARPIYERAAAIARELAVAGGSNERAMRRVEVRAVRRIAFTYGGEQTTEALRFSEEAARLAGKLHEEDPASEEDARQYTEALDELASAYVDASGDLTAAAAAVDRGLEIRQRYRREMPDSQYWWRNLSVSLERKVRVARAANDTTRAIEWIERVLEEREGIVKAFPADVKARHDLGIAYSFAQDDDLPLPRSGLTPTALADKGFEVIGGVLREDPSNAMVMSDYIIIAADRARSHLRQGDAKKSAETLQEALPVGERLFAIDQGSLDGYQRYVGIIIEAIQTASAMNDSAAILELSRRGVTVTRTAMAKGVDPFTALGDGQNFMNQILDTTMSNERVDEGLAAANERIALMEEALAMHKELGDRPAVARMHALAWRDRMRVAAHIQETTGTERIAAEALRTAFRAAELDPRLRFVPEVALMATAQAIMPLVRSEDLTQDGMARAGELAGAILKHAANPQAPPVSRALCTIAVVLPASDLRMRPEPARSMGLGWIQQGRAVLADLEAGGHGGLPETRGLRAVMLAIDGKYDEAAVLAAEVQRDGLRIPMMLPITEIVKPRSIEPTSEDREDDGAPR